MSVFPKAVVSKTVSPEGGDDLVRRALHPLGPVGAQAAAHGVNFAAQALLAAAFGAETYGALGLALIIAATLCFLGEMGYPTLFLREAASRPDWLPDWRRALGRRAVGLAVAAVAVVVWRAAADGWDDPGTRLLLGAAPGVVASAFAPAPVLYGLGAVRRAAATVYLRWATHGVGMLAVAAFCSAENVGLWTGVVFSLGMLAQIPAGLAVGAPAGVFLPSFRAAGSAVPPIAADARRMWIMACLGAAHGRAAPFLAEMAAPALLVPALFAHQALQGLAGLFGQLDRVTLPQLARQGGASDPAGRRRAARLVLWPSAAAAPLLAAAALTTAAFGPVVWGSSQGEGAGSAGPILAAAGFFLLLEWQVQMIGAAMTPIILAKRREAALCAVFVRLVPASLAIQVGLAAMGWFFPALAVRAAVVAAAAWRAVELADAEPPRVALASAAATLAATAGALVWAMTAGGRPS